jgi:ATP adenylyltransferase
MQAIKSGVGKLKDLYKENDLFLKYASELRQTIRTKFQTSNHIMKSEIQEEFYTKDGVKYLLKILIKNEIAKKPILIDKKDFFDPFAPPFDDGFVIEDDFCGLSTHRVLFNKFPIINEHVLVVTREFISQYTHLSIEDMRGALLIMTLMEGIVYFNGGKNAGASQPRKHVQCLPMSELYNGDFGIFKLINDDSNLLTVSDGDGFIFCELKQFKSAVISHCICKFSPELSETLKKTGYCNYTEHSDLLYQIYREMLKSMDLISEDDKEAITNDYSFLMTHDWMLIVPRKTNVVKLDSIELNWNSAAYIMCLLIRSEDEKKAITDLNILKDIYSKL